MTIFLTLSKEMMIDAIDQTQSKLIYAAPGLDKDLAQAIAGASEKVAPESLSVVIDPDPKICRFGFGEIESIAILKDANIDLRKTIGLRMGVLITDHYAWAFTPTPRLLESRPKAETPNALALSEAQAQNTVDAIMPSVDVANTKVKEPEIGSSPVDDIDIKTAQDDLKLKPPQKFDLARTVRVYSSYIQFVELSLSGCHINRHRLEVPPELLLLSQSDESSERLKSTYQLIDKNSCISNKVISNKLDSIRKDYLIPLGKTYGSVILRHTKEDFMNEMSELEEMILNYKKEVEKNLESEIEKTIEDLAKTLTPLVLQNPPKDFTKRNPTLDEESARTYTKNKILRKAPKAKNLIRDMRLSWVFKDVTYEMLTDEDFQRSLKDELPSVSLYTEQDGILSSVT